MKLSLTRFGVAVLGALPFVACGVNAASVKGPKPIRDCAVCPEMVVVPAGRFEMGDLIGSGRSNEKPVHTVSIAKPFAIGRYEVTFAEWDACTADGACQHRPTDEGWGRGNRPVTDVSSEDAQVYVLWLNKKTGKKYRLPSEAEWEYAARAGTTSAYYWGDKADGSNATFGKPASSDNPTSAVGSFPANAFGLHDMAGNLREWVADCWHNTYKGAPSDGSAWTQRCDEERGVVRGGAWNNNAERLRSSARDRHSAGSRHSNVGFRLVRAMG